MQLQSRDQDLIRLHGVVRFSQHQSLMVLLVEVSVHVRVRHEVRYGENPNFCHNFSGSWVGWVGRSAEVAMMKDNRVRLS